MVIVQTVAIVPALAEHIHATALLKAALFITEPALAPVTIVSALFTALLKARSVIDEPELGPASQIQPAEQVQL